ncbi:interleukin-31 receptor subunit alpha-like isoform X1 [Alosa sapidissima]|uniref:interleukin-31 receptor subunit alpha-like isoform X1 n=2 Tax=Alosa sapidissima TaxID=34773 RepID=UPI001C0947B1|nr:interleukin-31 receptor subunit alpha-like isoform X1 [Alosa sapidissima]XP_041916080.1 interleukin-31 receptor subunit alpha-like isoform X1 [Alosa sapidissima]
MNDLNPRIMWLLFTMTRFAFICLLCATMSGVGLSCRNSKMGMLPKNSQNITCVTRLRPFIEKGLTCWWNPLGISTSTLYSVTLTRQHSAKHTEINTTDNCYFFPSPGMGYHVTVSVAANSSNDTWQIHINNLFDIVKFDPPDRVWAEAYPGGIRVNWENEEMVKSLKRNVICDVQYRQEAPHIKNVWSTTTGWHKGSNTMNVIMNITDVKPCFNYTASVRCSFGEQMSPWSEWRSSTTFLPLSVNSIALHLWRRVLKLDELGRRVVDLMWKGPPMSCHAIDGYNIFVDSNFTGYLEPTQNQTSIVLSATTHRVMIAAYKNEAMLCNDSVVIPGVAECGPPVHLAQATAGNGQILVSWETLLYNVSSYMVVWYTNRSIYMWLQTQDTNLLFPGVPQELYTVIVTPLYNDTPGNDSTLYIYTEEGDPAKVTGVEVTDVDDTWAKVGWDTVPPDHCCGFVLNYTVLYKATDTQQPELNVTVNNRIDQPGRRHSVILKDLQPGTAYSVYVVASSIAGSSESNSYGFTTRQFGRVFIMVLVRTGFGGLLLLITALSIFILLWKMRFHKVPNPRLSTVGQWTGQDSKMYSSPWGTSHQPLQSMPCDISTLEAILPLHFYPGETHQFSPRVCTDLSQDKESVTPGRSTRVTDTPDPTDTPSNRAETNAGFEDKPLLGRHSDEPCLEQTLPYISVKTGQTLACTVETQGSSLQTKSSELEPGEHGEPGLEQILDYISMETGQTSAHTVVTQGSTLQTKSAEWEPGEQSTVTTALSYITVDQCHPSTK